MARSKGDRYGWMAFTSLCLVSLVVSGIAWNTLSLFADPVIKEWGILRTQYMFIMTLIAGINTFVSFALFGKIEEKFGIRAIMVASLLFHAVAMLVFYFADGLVMLYLAGLLWGMGLSLGGNSMRNTAVMYWFKKRCGTMVSVVAMVGQGSGVVFTAMFAAIIVAAGWRSALLITCACCAAAAVVCFFLYKGNPEKLGVRPLYDEGSEDDSADAEESQGVSFAEALRTKQFYTLCLAWFTLGIGADGIMSSLVLIASDYGYVAQAGMVLSACLLSSTVFSPVGGWICDKFGSRVLVNIGIGLLVVSCGLLCLGAVPLWLLFVIAVFLGFVWNCSIVPQASSTIEVFGRRDFAKKNTIFVSMQCLGVAVAPPFLNAFYDFAGGYGAGYAATAVLAVITFFLFAGVKTVKREDVPA